MAERYSDRRLDEMGAKLKLARQAVEAQKKRDEKKLNDARESALRYAHYRETGRQ